MELQYVLSKMGLQLFPQCFHSTTAALGPTSHCSATRADCSERICCASSTASCSRPHTRSHQVTAVSAVWIFLGVHSFSAVHWNRIYKIRAFQCMSSLSSTCIQVLILIQTWHSCVMLCDALWAQSPACSDLCSDSSARSTHGTDPHFL